MRVFSLALALALVLCAVSSAQDTTATIEGRVLDPSGRVITGAVVRATNTSTGYTRSQITSSSGGYHLSLPAATYDILVEAPEFARLTQKDLARLDGEEKIRNRMSDSLKVIERESMRCGDLMKSLLAFSRQSPIRRAPFDVNEVVNRSAQLVRHQMELAEIELRFKLAKGLNTVDGDAAQIQQILLGCGVLTVNEVRRMKGLPALEDSCQEPVVGGQ